jgi:hypothetical protein
MNLIITIIIKRFLDSRPTDKVTGALWSLIFLFKSKIKKEVIFAGRA